MVAMDGTPRAAVSRCGFARECSGLLVVFVVSTPVHSSMNCKVVRVLILLVFFIVGGSFASAQTSSLGSQEAHRIFELERKVAELEKKAGRSSGITAPAGAMAYLFGAFCALWAQNTRRSAWLWFFLGLFFSVFAVIVLLVKNSGDRFERQQRDRYTGGRT